MFENTLKFVSKVEDKASQWLVDHGTSIEQAEKMCIQFLQHLGQLRNAQAVNQPPAEQPKAEVVEMPEEQKAEEKVEA